MSNRWGKLPLLGAVLSVIAAGFTLPSPTLAANRTCTQQQLEVSLTPGAPAQYTVAGELCWRGSLEDEDDNIVQVLVHGGTYDRSYWDFRAVDPNRYSYVDNTIRRYVTFNYDRLGGGASDVPPGFENTLDSNAFVLHQIIEALRAGDFEGVSFEQVVTVGHSYGSLVAVAEASTYQDVDGLVLTGYLHDLSPQAPDLVANGFYPADLDPKFAGQGLTDYFTTVPGTRAAPFFNTDFAQPEVIAADEELKSTISAALLINDGGRFFSPESQAITAPVLLLIGENDALFCGNQVNCSDRRSVRSHEAPFFTGSSCFRAEVIREAGHSLNLHRNAENTFERIRDWTRDTVERGRCS